jgi:lipid II:glycine glycyltransferase (peptidoglycan interpeptide bridge formation enzyme)
MAELVDYGGALPQLPGFELERKMCHVLDLRGGYETVWETRYDRTQRKTQRSARDRGIEITEIGSSEELSVFHRLYEGTYGPKGSDVFPLDDLVFMFETLGPDVFRGYLAIHEGTPVAGTVSLFHPNVAVGFLQGSSPTPEHRSLRPVNLLIDESIQDAIRRGGRAYNLGVTPKDATGVVKFKESFGAVRREFPVQVKRELIFKLKSRLKG